jgi:signal peptidase I
MMIFFVILIFILGLLFNALILNFLGKKFKIRNNSYKNALKISLFEWLATILIGFIVGIFLSNLLGNVIVGILVFLVFNALCKKYYFTNFKKNIYLYLLLNLILVVISLIIILPVRFFIAEPFYNKGAAMEPTFTDQTYMVIKKFNNTFDRGDVVVFKYPKDQSQYFIKRIIGLPREKVEIKDGAVYIYNSENPNGLKLGAPYILDGIQVLSLDNNIVSLGADEYYVLGDNPSASKDSRSFGPVKKDLMVGKYWFAPFVAK